MLSLVFLYVAVWSRATSVVMSSVSRVIGQWVSFVGWTVSHVPVRDKMVMCSCQLCVACALYTVLSQIMRSLHEAAALLCHSMLHASITFMHTHPYTHHRYSYVCTHLHVEYILCSPSSSKPRQVPHSGMKSPSSLACSRRSYSSCADWKYCVGLSMMSVGPPMNCVHEQTLLLYLF